MIDLTRESVCFWRASDPEYIDVDVYIPDPDVEGAEWNIMITKVRKTGIITVGEATYAQTKDDSFEDRGNPPPYAVMAQLAEAMPGIVDYINECERNEQ